MRAFIAIELEEEVKDCLEEAQKQAQSICKKGNYTPKENFHITLHFLGEITTDDIEYLHLAMVETARFQRAFSLKLDKIGFFPRGREGVMWAGVEKSNDLFRLFNQLEKSLGKQGFGREKKGLSPHITLGREVEPYRGFNDVQRNVQLEQKEFRVTSIALMESVRMGRKLIYRPVVVQKLKENKKF